MAARIIHGLACLCLTTSLLAQNPGTVDTNFPVALGWSGFNGTSLIQIDDKVFSGGSITNLGGIFRTNIVRLNADGTLDTNFTYAGGVNASLFALQSDGKVIVVMPGGPFRMARLDSNGSVESGYTNFFNSGTLLASAVQPSDDKLLFSGTFSTVTGINRNRLARLNTDGSLDLTFPDVFAGIAIVVPKAIAVQSDGKILVGGNFTTVTSPPRTNIMRLNSNGTLDATFNASLLRLGFATDPVETIVMQPDGKILVGGVFNSVNGVGRTNIVRLNSDGSLDTNFVANTFFANATSIGGVFAVAVEPSGHVLMAGTFRTVNGIGRTNIARLNPNGDVDFSFDAGTGADNIVRKLALQTNSAVILGGDFTSINSIARNRFVRLQAGRIKYSLDQPIPLPGGHTAIQLAESPIIAPTNRAIWDDFTKTLYPNTVGDVTITWTFTNAPTNVVVMATIVPLSTETFDLGQQVPVPAGVVTNQSPEVDPGATFWHQLTGKLYVTAPGPRTIIWKRSNTNLTFTQQILGQWPTNLNQYQIHVAGSAPVDITAGGNYGSPTLFAHDAATGATLTSGQFSATNAGRSLLMVSSPGASAPFTNIFFQRVNSIPWNDANYLRDTNTAIIGEEIFHPEHNPACGSPSLVDYAAAFPGRCCADPFFYNRTNRTGPIIPVNRSATGTRTNDLVLALYQFGAKLSDPLTGYLLSNSVAWPSLPVRYLCQWPANSETIFIAGGQGSGPVALSDPNWSVYRQPNTNQYGYNPNEEHAFRATANPPAGGSNAVYALRNDLGDAFGTASPKSSEPYVLLKYTNAFGQGRIKVYRVQAEDTNHLFRTFQLAGQLLQPPSPLTSVCSNRAFGPYFRDRNGAVWAKAAGISNGLPVATNITLHYFYQPATNFDPPPGSNAYSGAECLPWLDRYAATTGTPIGYAFTITWPTNAPELRVGETLVKPKNGLPEIANQCSVDVIYEQSGEGSLVRLYDPMSVRAISVNLGFSLPPEIITQVVTEGNQLKHVFMQVPLSLRKRLRFNATSKQFEFSGVYNDTDYVGEPLLLPNVMTESEANLLKALSANTPANAAYRAAINALFSKTVLDATGIASLGGQFKALSAALPQGQGYVSLAFQNATNCNASPVSLQILKVTCPLYQGDIKPLYADCAFDEIMSLRHSADFAGSGDGYGYQWFSRKSGTTIWAEEPGQTNQELTIKGPGLKTLQDYEYKCHYQLLSGGSLCGTNFSSDTNPQLADGWIKRVLQGVTPFNQISGDFHATALNTTANMIEQAGPRWAGNSALNCSPGNEFGLIAAYETVLKRGIDLSIGSGIPLIDDTALRLAAGQISDLYMLLGNEAYGDAQDPTIGFGTDGGQFTATSIHCFQGQTTSLLQEELMLLRGRDGTFGPGDSPVYNRLYWNFGPDPAGQSAYVLNYSITDKDGSGTINSADARIAYPQGHGDAWGHYLSAAMAYYQLFANSNYTWVPESEKILINAAIVEVNYQHERKFAKVAAARARTGAEIVNLTYRSMYVEDPANQWQGYPDSNTNRAWGVSEWASRAGQAALFDWLAGNALLPTQDTNSLPQQRVDRTTVIELRELAASFLDLQQTMDNADRGLNPLGLNKNVVPFGLDPGLLTSGQTHFEQIYDRAVMAMNNAISVFNYANQPTQLLRKQQDTLVDFQRNVNERLNDFTNRLIEIFGYPYNEDIGGAGAYGAGYVGPDLYHFAYVDEKQLTGNEPPGTQSFALNVRDLAVASDGTVANPTRLVNFNLSTNDAGLVKPANFTARQAPGELQRALSELIQANARLKQGIATYDNLIAEIEGETELLGIQYQVNANEIYILKSAAATQRRLNDAISDARKKMYYFQDQARQASDDKGMFGGFIGSALGSILTGNPASFIGFIADTVADELWDMGHLSANEYSTLADKRAYAEMEHLQAKEEAQTAASLQLTSLHQSPGIAAQLARIQQLVRQETVMRYDLFNLNETVRQASGNYTAILAKGNRLLEDQLRFKQQSAAQIQTYRYQDMAFRVFRNDALQKYRAQYDLAARYVYLAAKAYDYETGLLQTSSQSGSAFLEDIVKKRAIGTIQNGIPQPGNTGDSGLAAPMAAMGNNYATIKANLGLNNTISRERLFSLRNGWFRIANGGTNAALWQQTLRRARVENIWDIPEYQRYCRPLRPEPVNGREPAIVIRFPSEIIAENNFFGWPAGGGDSSYNASIFSTKIRSVGIWFSSYDSSANGLVQFPNAWLVPVGEDVVRAAGANDFSYRHWKVFDQKIPVPNNFLNTPPNFSLNWIPINFSLNGEFGAVGGLRQYNTVEATTESQSIPLDPAHMLTDSGLVGRSVWNTQWMLIIPGVSLLGSNPDEGLERFIAGALVGGQRTGNGVTDVKIYFQTYSYSGF